MKNYQKGSALIILLVLIAIVVLGSGAYYYQKNKGNASNLKNYINDTYNFSIEYPEGTVVDTTPGNQIDNTSRPGKIAVFQPTGTMGSLTIEVESASAQCNDSTSGIDRIHKTINGISFVIYNEDKLFSGATKPFASARKYCVIYNGIEYKLITLLRYDDKPLNVDEDTVLNQMIGSFTFIK